MPELPDIEVYREALAARLVGQTLGRIRLKSPFLLRTVAPPLEAAEGRTVLGVRRLGKRVVLALSGEVFLVIHLMIAGRLRWQDGARKRSGASSCCGSSFPMDRSS
jgi:formamidopyrimidine-DNA glycosylase